MGRPSSIKLLPTNFREQIDAWLLEGDRSLDDLVGWLNERGYDVSRSAMGRYRQSFERAAARVRRSREIAQAIAQEADTGGESRASRVLVEMIQSEAIELIAGLEDEAKMDARSIMQVAAAAKNLAQTLSLSTQRELELEKRLRAEMAAKLDDVEAEAEAAGEKGLSADRVAQLRRDFLGVRT